MSEQPMAFARVLAAPFQLTEAVAHLGRALWLYVWLVAIANYTGRVCRTAGTLAKDLGVPEGRIAVWLSRLVEHGLVVVQGEAPYLVLKLRFWPASVTDSKAKPTESSDATARSQGDVPVSSSKQQAAAASSKPEDGGVGEGETLLAEVLEALGEHDAAQFRELIARFPADIVKRAMLRVKVTPSFLIRKSRAALFRYLLAKFTAEAHDGDESR